MEKKKTLLYLSAWLLIGTSAAVIGTAILQSFLFLLITFQDFAEVYIHSIPLPLLTLAGAAITGGIIYRFSPDSSGEGMPGYIKGLEKDKSHFNLKSTISKYFAALFTLSTYGNGGVIGPVGRVSAGIMSKLTEIFPAGREKERIRRTAAICGLASVIGAIFHAPIGGGIFAVEISQRRTMRYTDLFPAILSSSLSVLLMESLHLKALYKIDSINAFIPIHSFIPLILVIFLTAFISRGFNELYKGLSLLTKREEGKHLFIKTIIGSVLAILIVFPFQPLLMGTSRNFISILTTDPHLLHGILGSSVPIFAIMAFYILIKSAGNILTVGSGLSAGFAGPLVIIGMMAGVLVSDIFHMIPAEPAYSALMAAGFAGILAGSMNIPIAAAVISTELFGSHYGFPAALSSIISFQINRRSMIYEIFMDKTSNNSN